MSVSTSVQNEDSIKLRKSGEWEAYYFGSFHLRKPLWWIAQWRHRYTSILFKWPWEETQYEAAPTERLHLFSSEKDKPSGLRSLPWQLTCVSGMQWATEHRSWWKSEGGEKKSRDLDVGIGNLGDYTAFESSIVCPVTERADLSKKTLTPCAHSLDGWKDRHC